MHVNVMRAKSAPSLISSISIAILALSGAAAQGQTSAAQAPANSQAQVTRSQSETDIGVNFYRAFNSTTTANGVIQTPVDAYGGMVEFRHIHSPLIGYELTYGYNSGNETIGPAPQPACIPVNVCDTPPQALTSDNSLVGLDWVFSKKFGNLRPFATAGMGFFIAEPGRSTYGVNDTVRLSYLYGGGLDYAFSTHFGVRVQYRGLAYKVPNLSMLFPAQGIYTQTREPMGGVFYRF